MVIRARDARAIREGIRIARLHRNNIFGLLTVLDHASADQTLTVRAFTRTVKRQLNREYVVEFEEAKRAAVAH